MTFDTLGLHPKIMKGLEEAGYSEPTEIQLKAIPKILKGFDLRASAQTGTGKTAAFLLPAIHRLMAPSEKSGKGPRVVILAPTRELAMQIAGQAEKYSHFLNKMRTVCVVGGVPYHIQERKLARPCDIMIATPGRLIDFIQQRKIKFSRLEMLVLDEADRMLDMGFVDPVREIVAAMPKTKQTLMFTATMEKNVINLSEELLNKPMEITVHAKHDKHENIEQKLHMTDSIGHKFRILDHILGDEEINHAIIFTSTKRSADQLVEDLDEKGHRTAALHGDMSQRQRTRTITRLREGKIKILVATDVAARGIDVQTISHVINFDLPQNAEDYVHRIGRTGRAGASGTAVSFAGRRDNHMVKKIEQFTGQKIEQSVIKGLEPSKDNRPSGFNKKRSFGGRGKPGEKRGQKRPFKRKGPPPRGGQRKKARY